MITNQYTPNKAEYLTHPKYRADIDGLRAIAVLSVVGFHGFPFWIKGGFIGVDVFFVISGFLISTIIFDNLERNSFSFIEFYSRRIKRIFPALLLVLIACFTFGWFALLADEYKQLGKHIAAGAGFVSNFVFWNESGYFDNMAETKPLLHLWTLGIEEQFYIVWPLLLWAAWKMKFNLLTVTMVIAIISFVLNVKGIRTDAVATFYSPQTRFWELLTGSTLALIEPFKQNIFVKQKLKLDRHLGAVTYGHISLANGNKLRNVQSLLGAVMISAGFLIITKERHFPGTWALLPTLGTVLIISAGSQAWLNRIILSHRLLVWFGLISFPLYLWHWPLLSFARIIESETPTRNIRVSAVFVSIILAYLTYKLIEKPIRFGNYGHIKTITLSTLMVIVSSVGYNIFKADGFAFRHKSMHTNSQQQNDWGDINYFDATCLNEYLDYRQEVSNYCKKSKPTPTVPTVLIVGDSHSNHLYPGMADVTADSAENILNLASGCLPFFGVSTIVDGGKDLCKNSTSPINYVETHDSLKTVIISIRGTAYFHSNRANDPEHGTHLNTHFVFYDHPELTNRRDVFISAMKATLERLLSKGKKVIFVLDNPMLTFDPKLCLDIRPLRLTKKKDPCALSRTEFEENSREYREIVTSVLKGFPTVEVFDTATVLCDEKLCWAMRNGNLLYRDIDHLSIEGSKLIAKELVKLLPKTN